jgi:hypothetical protein
MGVNSWSKSIEVDSDCVKIYSGGLDLPGKLATLAGTTTNPTVNLIIFASHPHA